MKTFTLTAGLVGFLVVGGCATTVVAQPYGYGGSGVTVGAFYDTLSPYGEWVEVDGYGRVWRPYPEVVGVDFQPYSSNGHWVYTDYGWSFESDFDWGWAPFHYGRWWTDPAYGWVWRPDTVWAPAWVDWRFGGGYVGWTPLAPPGIVVVERYRPSWCFVETRYFVDRDFYRYTVPRERIHVAFSATNAIHEQVTYGGARWYSGPPAQHIATAVGQPIQPVRVAPPQPGYVQPVHMPTPAYVSNARPPGGQGAQSFGGRPPPAQSSYPPPHSNPGSTLATPANHPFSQPPSPPNQGYYRPPTGNGSWQPPGHAVAGSFGTPQPPATRYSAPPPSAVGSRQSGGWDSAPGSHGGGGGGYHPPPPPSAVGSGFHAPAGGGGGSFHPPPPAAPHAAARPPSHWH